MKLTDVMDSVGEPTRWCLWTMEARTIRTRCYRRFTDRDRHVDVVRERRNFGQTPALKAGIDFARGDIVISMDGDQRRDPEEIPRFLEKIEEGYDLVSGWRRSRDDHWLMKASAQPHREPS